MNSRQNPLEVPNPFVDKHFIVSLTHFITSLTNTLHNLINKHTP